MRTKTDRPARRELTLKDRLSRLTFTRACKLLGDEGRGQHLADCVEPDEQGRLKLNITLPDASALDSLADSLARLLGLSQ